MRVNGRYSTPASVAIALTVLRKNGIVEFIDSHCLFDEDQRKLTPGEVALILIGATMMSNNRIPLYRIENLYRHMNISGILGKKVESGSLNDHALGRGLDTIFRADRDQMMWDISERFELDLGLVARIFHIDQTKIRTYVIEPHECDGDAAKPEFGLDKEGRTDFRLYSSNSITDESKLLRHLSAADGNESDVSMDADAVDFLVENVDPGRSTAVIDSKGANAELIAKMMGHGLGFVTKCPVNFSSCLKKRLSREVFNDHWTVSEQKKGHMFYDVDVDIDGETLEDGGRAPKRRIRAVAFRSSKMLSDRRASIVRSHLKAAEKAGKELSRKRFDSEDDALLEVGTIQEGLCDNAYSLKWSLVSEDVRIKRTKAGRPKSDEVPEFTRQWTIECEPVIDDWKLEVLTDLGSIEVLVTNLPRIPSGERMENVRDGASSESVLELYLDQYKQEHTFKLLKGKVGLNDVFFKNPERETAMMFVLGLAALIRNVIDLMFRRIPGRFTTCQDMVASWLLLRLRVVDGEIELEGPEGCEADMLDVMRRLDLDEGMIVDSIERPTV